MDSIPTLEKSLLTLELRTFSKEKREQFAKFIRKDPELWNIVHGIGGHSKYSEDCLVVGLVFLEDNYLPNVKIKLMNESRATENITYSNQLGFFNQKIPSGEYLIVFEYNGINHTNTFSIEPGETQIQYFDFTNAKS